MTASHVIGTDEDRFYMEEAIELASMGAGRTWPNPMVGAIIVKNGQRVGSGFHARAGQAHAEVNALATAGSEAKGATCYVTLEPCCVTGRTGPCTSALIEAGIKRVVYGMRDPNPRVDGRGVKLLQKEGIETLGPILEDACRALNAPFIVAQTQKRPFITLKLALSLDGMIADKNRNSSWITGAAARITGHTLRAQHQAVLVGAETLRRDDPRLTPRDAEGFGLDNPTRVIITRGSVDLRGKAILEDLPTHPVWVLTSPDGAQSDDLKWAADQGVKILETETDTKGSLPISGVQKVLFEQGIMALFCEGGANIAAQLIRADAVDRMHIFRAPIALGSQAGLPGIGDLGINELSEAKRFRRVGVLEHGPDIEEILEREITPW